MDVPIVDRDAGRVPVRAGRGAAADRRGRDGLRLLDAVAGARPAGRRHDRDDRPGPRRGRTSPGAGGARPASPTSGSRSSPPRRSRRSQAGDPALAGPFDLAFIDALKPEYGAYLDGLIDGAASPRVRWSSPTTSCGAAACRATRPTATASDGNTAALRAFDARVLARRAVHGHDPAGRRRPARRDLARLTRSTAMRVRVRLFAIQRELAGTREVALELPDGATVGRRLGGAGGTHPGAGARAALGPLRPERRVRRRRDRPRRRRRGRDDPAGVRGRGGRADPPARADPRAAGATRSMQPSWPS